MKSSRYNFFFDAEDGAHLAFNGMSGGFARIDDADRDEVRKMIAAPDAYELDTEQKRDLWDSLVRGRFLIGDEVDELAMLKVRNAKGRYANNGLWLTIAPTLDCNFRCPYCYEDIPDELKMSPMDGERVQSLIRFVTKMVKNIRGLRVDWYGGEPLLCPETIHELNAEFVRLALEQKCSYKQTMVTNGYLLTPETAERLKEGGLYSVQVTLDGPPTVHDKRRFLANGKGTFDTIMDNLKKVVDIINMVSIRVNIDRKNMDSYEELFDVLIDQGLRDRVTIYPGRVEADVGSRLAKSSLDSLEYMETALQFLRRARERGFKTLLATEPRFKLESCRAVALNGWVIDPMLNLYKCWGVLGDKDFAVGRITSDGSIATNNGLMAWLTWDPLEREQCRKCKSLPICMGGCMENDIRRLMNKTVKMKDTCLELKNSVIDILRLCYKSRLEAETEREKGGEFNGVLDRSSRIGTGG